MNDLYQYYCKSLISRNHLVDYKQLSQIGDSAKVQVPTFILLYTSLHPIHDKQFFMNAIPPVHSPHKKTWSLLRYLNQPICFLSLLFFISTLVIFFIWKNISKQVQTDKRNTIQMAVNRNDNLVVAFEQYTIRALHNAESILQFIKMEFEKNKGIVDFEVLFNNGIIDKKYISGIAILDQSGQIISSDLALQPGFHANFSDRAYFRYHKDHQDRLHISEPLFSRTIKKAVIVVSRRLNNPDGSFAGVIALQIEPDIFTQFYAEANLNPDDLISIVNPEGITYARKTGQKESFGEDISKSPLYNLVVKNRIGNYFAENALTGVPTYFSYRRLNEYPIIATAGVTEKNVLRDFYSRARLYYLFASILTVLVVFFCGVSCLLFFLRKKHTKIIKTSEARYRSIFHNGKDAIILLTDTGIVKAMNAAANKLFYIKDDAILEQPLSVLYKSLDKNLFYNEGNHFMPSGSTGEIIFTCNDDNQFTGEIALSTYEDISGCLHYVLIIRDVSNRRKLEQQVLNQEKQYQQTLTRQIILAQEKERELIGYELHDNVNQILTSAKLYLEMAVKSPPLRKELMQKSIGLIMKCIDEIRKLSRELSAPTLGTSSLADSIAELIAGIQITKEVRIHFDHDQYKDVIDKDQMLAIFRIVQEQLTNILKHSKASDVHITLAQDTNNTCLQIVDNGKGFNLHEQRNGIGLNNISSRTKVFGGQVEINSAPGCGCSLMVKLPRTEVKDVVHLPLKGKAEFVYIT